MAYRSVEEYILDKYGPIGLVEAQRAFDDAARFEAIRTTVLSMEQADRVMIAGYLLRSFQADAELIRRVFDIARGTD